jgi:hypothetical protein
MPTNRFQFSDDFVLNNGKVGINSSSPQETLDVVGVTKGQDLKIVGVSSFIGYEGFLNSNQNIVESINLESGQGITGSLSGEIIIGTGVTVTGFDVGIGTTTVGLGTTGTTTNALFPATTSISGQGQVESLKVYNTFTVPVGGTADRPTAPKPGMLFYNRDFATMEFWNGNVWRQVDNTTQSGRGVFSGGAATVNLTVIDYINIVSTGNALSFGSLSSAISRQSGCSSEIRGVFGGGGPTPSVINTIEYITIASQGNSINFGSLSVARETTGACSSSTRGIWMGGRTPTNQNVIDYVQIGTLGTALDFGDLLTARQWMACCSSPTRGIAAGGEVSQRLTTIEAVTISSTGNAIYFGDLTQQRGIISNGVTSGVRGVFGGGEVSPFLTNRIDYITIATLGNAIYFGDLTVNRFVGSGTSSKIRGIFAGGSSSSNENTIDYVTIVSTGNAQDFGDLTISRFGIGGCSDSHGGLGGF